MKCPKCNTNIYGNPEKCLVCGHILRSVVDTKKEKNVQNGILDPKDFNNYLKNLELYKNKNKEQNFFVPIIIIFIIVIFIILIAFLKYVGS